MYETFAHFSLVARVRLLTTWNQIHISSSTTCIRDEKKELVRITAKTKDFHHFSSVLSAWSFALRYLTWAHTKYMCCAARWIVHVSESNSILYDMMNGLCKRALSQLEPLRFLAKIFRVFWAIFAFLNIKHSISFDFVTNNAAAGRKGWGWKICSAREFKIEQQQRHDDVSWVEDENVKAINQI